MEFRFFFGPDKIQFEPDENGIIVPDSVIPFHGIISRGLINPIIENKISIEDWYKNAHKLGSLIAASELEDENYLKLRRIANECKVLSFGQSALCAKLYVRDHCPDLNIEDGAICEIWNIKEGHTSSVWMVNLGSPSPQNSKEFCFILNVARDSYACVELEEQSEKMKAIAKHCTRIHMAKVLDIQKVLFNYSGVSV